MRATLIAMSLMLLPIAACESPQAGNTDLARAVEGRLWHAETIAGKPVAEGSRVTLKIAAGRAGGKAGCNAYGGPVEIHGDRIKFGSIFRTEMACVGSGVMEQESSYLKLLQGAARGEVRGDGTLIITGDSGALVFRPE
jgi:heat shock protein HslJ